MDSRIAAAMHSREPRQVGSRSLRMNETDSAAVRRRRMT